MWAPSNNSQLSQLASQQAQYIECWFKVGPVNTTLIQHLIRFGSTLCGYWVIIIYRQMSLLWNTGRCPANIKPMPLNCWSTICHAGPTFNRHWFDVWYLLIGLESATSKHDMLIQCWATVYNAGPTLSQHCVNISRLLGAQQTRGIHPMLFQFWPTVFDAGPTLRQHWVNSSCSLGGAVNQVNTRVPMCAWWRGCYQVLSHIVLSQPPYLCLVTGSGGSKKCMVIGWDHTLQRYNNARTRPPYLKSQT